MKYLVVEVACTVHPDEPVIWPDAVAQCRTCGHDLNLDERTTRVEGASKEVEWGTNHYEAVPR